MATGASAGAGDGFGCGSCATGLGVGLPGGMLPVDVAVGAVAVAVAGACGCGGRGGGPTAAVGVAVGSSAPAVAVGGRVLLGAGAVGLVCAGIEVGVADGAGGVQGNAFCPGALPEESGMIAPATAASISATPIRTMVVVDCPP